MIPPSPTISPSRTGSSLPVETVVFPAQLDYLAPRQTPAPLYASCNAVVVQLTTTLVITDFSNFYATPIDSFRPTYVALQDGTLLTPPFQQDLKDTSVSLLITGALAMLFLRNILVSGDYLRRGKVKKKTLFHILFYSQILAPIAFIPLIASYFTSHINCTIVVILPCVAGTTSIALLITVILGVKTYRCLNNAKIVPIVLGVLQALSTAAVIFDVITMKGLRRLTGSCIRDNDLRATRIFVSIQFLESLFICCCFIFVIWRSRGSATARGRISLELSMADLPINIPSDNRKSTKRGWWDYAEEFENVTSAQPQQEEKKKLEKGRKWWRNPFNAKSQGDRSRSNEDVTALRKQSNASEKDEVVLQENEPEARSSVALSTMSRFSRLIPRMELFQEVMRDELFYTTFITSTCVIVAVLSVVGVNFQNGLSVTGWIALNWGIISMLSIHSFGRVVHRHEREALLSHPITCTAIRRTANELINQRSRRQVLSSASRVRNLRISTSDRSERSENPFSDTRRVQLQDPFISVEDPDRPPIDSDFRPQTPERGPSVLRSLHDNLQLSPQDQDFPTSNLGTPVVPVDNSALSRQQGFSESWLFSVSSEISNSNYSMSSQSRREEDVT